MPQDDKGEKWRDISTKSIKKDERKLLAPARHTMKERYRAMRRMYYEGKSWEDAWEEVNEKEKI